jgi:predicted RNase H-like nuclease (RuvC/YqgF family)
MSSTDDPQNTPEGVSDGTGRELLAQVLTKIEADYRDRERDRDQQATERREQAQFRTWLASQIKAMQADIASLAHDARLRNERITELENELSRLSCRPGGGNGIPCPRPSDDGGLEP